MTFSDALFLFGLVPSPSLLHQDNYSLTHLLNAHLLSSNKAPGQQAGTELQRRPTLWGSACLEGSPGQPLTWPGDPETKVGMPSWLSLEPLSGGPPGQQEEGRVSELTPCAPDSAYVDEFGAPWAFFFFLNIFIEA